MLYVGSFSKVLFPGLRIGYLVVPEAVVERFAQVAETAHPSPPLMIQQMVEAFMSEGHFARHLSRMRSLYAERRSALAAALDRDHAGRARHHATEWRHASASRTCAARSATSMSSHGCAHKGIGPTPLSRCAVTGPRPNGLMINYANVAKQEAGAAAERLFAAMR